MLFTDFWVWWALGCLLGLGVLVYLAMEYLAWLERTFVAVVPGGLRFVARGLQMEMQRGKERVLVQTQHGHYRQSARKGAPGAKPEEQSGAFNVGFPAHGLRISIAPEMRAAKGKGQSGDVPSGRYTLQFESKEDDSHLRIEKVPQRVAADFDNFARQASVWIEKLEERRQARLEDEAAQLAAAEQAAQAKTGGAGAAGAAPALTPDAQVALWRKNAGFSGSSSEIGLDEKGNIVWFVDLDANGRITLHSDKRTVHTTLAGAEFISLGGELEVAVRDDFWSEADPKLHRFRILKGRTPDERRAWKERMEILRGQLTSARSTH